MQQSPLPRMRPKVPVERLQKIIANAGITSRRKAEELITQGMVTVNGKLVTALGTKADAAHDHIKINGKLLRAEEKPSPVYIALNKPKGYVTTVSDPEKRPTVMQLIGHLNLHGARVYPVGRLDFNSEGLLILTNDGDLAHNLTHASSHVDKTYIVKIAGNVTEDGLVHLRRGISIEKEGRDSKRVRTSPARIKLFRGGENPWYEVTLIEGRNRQIRKMFEAAGHHVEKIRRIAYGPLKLDLKPGESRSLTLKEVSMLRTSAKSKTTKIHSREK